MCEKTEGKDVTFIVLQKNVRSFNASDRIEESIREAEGCKWENMKRDQKETQRTAATEQIVKVESKGGSSSTEANKTARETKECEVAELK